MALDLSDFITIDAGIYPIGLSGEDAEALWGRIRGGALKKEFFMNSVPRHEVEVGRFHMAGRLVTLGEFGEFVDATGYKTEAESDGWGWVWNRGWRKKTGVSWRSPFSDAGDGTYLGMKETVPVLQVSWNDFSRYCSWLSGVQGMAVEIPGEREWEIFARFFGAPSFDGIPGGDDHPDPEMPGTDFFFRAFSGTPGKVKTGILWEWTADWFDSYPGGGTNRDFGTVYKILRGGSWMSSPAQRCREYRFRRCPTARSLFYGLRVMVRGD